MYTETLTPSLLAHGGGFPRLPRGSHRSVARAGLGRRLAVTILLINAAGDLLSGVLGNDPRTLAGLPIVGAMLYYLRMARVRAFFAAGRSSRFRLVPRGAPFLRALCVGPSSNSIGAGAFASAIISTTLFRIRENVAASEDDSCPALR